MASLSGSTLCHVVGVFELLRIFDGVGAGGIRRSSIRINSAGAVAYEGDRLSERVRGDCGRGMYEKRSWPKR